MIFWHRINRIVIRSDDAYTESDVTAFVGNRENRTAACLHDDQTSRLGNNNSDEQGRNRVAKYIGTDYHYVHSEAFRKVMTSFVGYRRDVS